MNTPSNPVHSLTERLEEIEKRANAATKGPWGTGGIFSPGTKAEWQQIWSTTPKGLQSGDILATRIAPVNAAFIAASRTDIPALVKAVRYGRECFVNQVGADSPILVFYDRKVAALLSNEAAEEQKTSGLPGGV